MIEIIQALGVLGIIGMLFAAGLKVFRLLPREARIYGQRAAAPTTDQR
jgi:hypothetical protein